MRLWRCNNHVELDGFGAELASGRWHRKRPGARVVYCAEAPATCLLELLAHLEVALDELPVHYRLLEIEVPDTVASDRLALEDLPKDWRDDASATQDLGDRWLASRSSVLLGVPSALVPATWNVLLNPVHPDAASIQVVAEHRETIDERLVR